MSQQGPILVVSTSGRPPFAAALDEAGLFPVIDIDWTEAGRAIEQLRPGAVLAAMPAPDQPALDELARQIASREPYLPLIVVDPCGALPENAIPFAQRPHDGRLLSRLNAALRVRSLQGAVMRRLGVDGQMTFADVDTARDATVLLIGRGGAYPALSVALGERMGVVGALSIEAAAKHLNTRDVDGIVLGEGFSPRVVDAFLTVLTEDSRFRNLPVIVMGDKASACELPNLECVAGDPDQIAAYTQPLIRQHAFEAQLRRTLRALDADGLVDARTGLLTQTAFDRDFAIAVDQAQANGGGLSMACFAFDTEHPRAQFDGARIVSRLMRQTDFGVARKDGSVVVVFTGTDLRNTHMIARRLSAVMRHTRHGRREDRAEPLVTVATLLPNDSAKTLLARLTDEAPRAAS